METKITKLETEDEEISDEEKMVCKVGIWKIYTDPRNYIVRDSRTERTKDGIRHVGRVAGYHRTLTDALEDIYQMNLKEKVADSRTIENLAKVVKSYHQEFMDGIKGLKELESVDLSSMRERA
jgi:hypothetical protein